jgi:murein DD-endopeptidase MepM/ murein hydrolase activator NlpD
MLAVLVAMVLGPFYAGADYGGSSEPLEAGMRVAAIDRATALPPAAPARSVAPAPPARIVRRVDVAPGDTLISLLADAGLDAGAAAHWSAAAADVIDPRHLRVGRSLTVEHDPTGALAVLRYEIDDASTLVVERTGDVLTARRETKPFTVEVRGVAGTIEHGFWRDLLAAGAPPTIASSLTRILGGEVDFRRVAVGDEFRVLYEVATQLDTGVQVPHDIVAAQVRIGGRLVTAIHYEDRSGRGGYYTPDGHALGGMMLRYPVAYTRISSGFSYRRFHPILRRYRPHLGVDFAAPRGTPVRATANGTVMLAGWKRGMGRMVRVRHRRGLETFYGHLSRIASGVRSGAHIQQGQVIGYVGSTGLATGNHLHYAVRVGGRFVNPLTMGTIRMAALPQSERRAFGALRDAVTTGLARLDAESAPVAVSLVSLASPRGSEG